MSTETQPQFKVGQFYRYSPKTNWCHEGLAEVTKHGILDTYWGGSSETSPLNEAERASAVLLFDSADYDELDRYNSGSKYRWEQHNPNERQKITEQHGCRTRWFIKKGAVPCIDTKIQNALDRLEEAEVELRSAKYRVESRTEEIARLVKEKDASLRTNDAATDGARGASDSDNKRP